MTARCIERCLDHPVHYRLDHALDRWNRPGGNLYPGRVLARLFGYVGVATVVYAVALVAIAVQSRILEF